MLEERAFFVESWITKPARLNCPFCKAVEEYELRWLVRTKRAQLPRGAGERDRIRFQKAQSYMVLAEDKVICKNPRCRKRFEVSGIKTLALL